MEFVIAFKQSKTFHKSLSYLSGIGGDLSFQLGYYVTLGKYSVRYFQEPISYSHSKLFDVNKREEFGEQMPLPSDYYDTSKVAERKRDTPVVFEDNNIWLERYRETYIAIVDVSDFYSIDKSVDERNDFLLGERYNKKRFFH